MGAVTANQDRKKKGDPTPISFPIASGEIIYQNTFIGIDASDGLGYNLDAALIAAGIDMVVIVADDTANPTGPAATTSAGAITGARHEQSAIAGDKTVRLCWKDGEFLFTLSGAGQGDVGKVAYATNNNTIVTSPAALGVPIGTITQLINTNTVFVDLNAYHTNGGNTITISAAISASGTGGGGAFSIVNPFGELALLKSVVMNITTGTTSSQTLDIGVAANASTSSDTIMDGVASTAAIYTGITDPGTSGAGERGIASSQVLTGSPSAALTNAVGTVRATFERI